jgi:hypothetical protein
MNVTDERSPESPPQIEAFEFDPPAIAEGEESKGIIKLSGPAPPETSIALEGHPPSPSSLECYWFLPCKHKSPSRRSPLDH